MTSSDEFLLGELFPGKPPAAPHDTKTLLRATAEWVYRGLALLVCLLRRWKTAGREPPSDQLIGVDEAATMMRVDKSWIYRRQERLPFIVRLEHGTIRVSKRSLITYIERRTGKKYSDEGEDASLQLPPPEGDKLLRPDEAAKFLGVSRNYFYDHEDKIPFVVRLSNGVLRVSQRRMLLWIDQEAEGVACGDSVVSTDAKGPSIGGSDTASEEKTNTKAHDRPKKKKRKGS